MKRRAPRKPVQCSVMRRWSGGAYRCLDTVRPVVVVAAELRTVAPGVRADHCAHEVEYAERYPGTAPGAREVAVGAARYVDYCLEILLPALALELEGALCQSCAYEAARRFVEVRRLVFEGLLAEYRTSGRDERAEEEFELARCAA